MIMISKNDKQKQSNNKQQSNDIQNDNQEEDYVELNKKIPNTIREYMNKNKLAVCLV